MMDTAARAERILSNSYSKNDCYKRLLVLQEFLEYALYSTGNAAVDYLTALRERFKTSPLQADAEAVAAWGEDFLRSFTAETLREDIDALKRALAHMPSLILYVPVALETPQISAIGSWCRSNIAEKPLLDLRVDPDAAGGCIEVWKSVLYDFSLRYRLRRHAGEIQALCDSLTADIPIPAPTLHTA